jgi:transglycosylase-like protein with SLT domain
MRLTVLFLFGAGLLCRAASTDYFSPTHQLSGVGVSRDDLSNELLQARVDLMIQSQTFTIMREPLAVPGAKRITADRRLQALFRQASERSGIPVSEIEAIAYLESWGDAKAESPSGPRGIMQISYGTAREMRLRVARTVRYRIVKEKVQVRGKNRKLVTRTVRHKIPYTVFGRDERLIPERAIPAAADYLARLENKFGGRDWAIFAYHCGEGCVSEMQELTRQARGIPKDEFTVARMFFSCSPAWNRELYQAVQMQMQRDYSPTYWFRVMRAEQLLEEYRRDPDAFESLAEQYKLHFSSADTLPRRASHRLSVWLTRDDLRFHSGDEIRATMGTGLVAVTDRPDFFGFQIRLQPDPIDDVTYLSLAAPSTVGTLTYIAFETRRLWQELGPKSEQFRPLEVTSLFEPEDYAVRTLRAEALAHGTGLVFDIDYAALPPAEYECLRFVLDDLGWGGYLGFVEEGTDHLHIGCSPASREFFTSVYQEALDQLSQNVKSNE